MLTFARILPRSSIQGGSCTRGAASTQGGVAPSRSRVAALLKSIAYERERVSLRLGALTSSRPQSGVRPTRKTTTCQGRGRGPSAWARRLQSHFLSRAGDQSGVSARAAVASVTTLPGEAGVVAGLRVRWGPAGRGPRRSFPKRPALSPRRRERRPTLPGRT